jgi:hypothetical protein
LKDVVETTLTIRMEFASLSNFWEPYEGRVGRGAEYVALSEAGRGRLRDAVEVAYLDGEPMPNAPMQRWLEQ